MNFIKLSRNGPYPLPIRAREGAAANFLTSSGNVLQIGMPNVVQSEARAVRNAPIEAGIIADGPLILWVFVIGSLVFDCPFDAWIIPSDSRMLPDIENDRQRLGIDIHLVDTATMVLKAIRYVTLPPELTRRFLAAVQDQLSDARDMPPWLAKYHNHPIDIMPTLAAVEPCGR